MNTAVEVKKDIDKLLPNPTSELKFFEDILIYFSCNFCLNLLLISIIKLVISYSIENFNSLNN